MTTVYTFFKILPNIVGTLRALERYICSLTPVPSSTPRPRKRPAIPSVADAKLVQAQKSANGTQQQIADVERQLDELYTKMGNPRKRARHDVPRQSGTPFSQSPYPTSPQQGGLVSNSYASTASPAPVTSPQSLSTQTAEDSRSDSGSGSGSSSSSSYSSSDDEDTVVFPCFFFTLTS